MSIEIHGIGHQAALQTRDTMVNSSMRAASDVIVEKEAAEQAENQKVLADPNEISKAAAQIQKLCDMCGRKLQFKVNKDTNRIVVKVIDTNTDKVIREIPSEEIQRLQARIRETVGLLFDETI
ncbi:flagellar protein FlaG [Treponema putidum]|uniref:Flagellar protein FlaG n=1 Tax=Treponema putidum TaxID=221027 RepID=A0AAE9SH78_9SPIR|nr:flagellar protein FlaG [Treponema putidum]AIN94704.1 flagellar protein FlaG [Treponema putidum]TWI77572.1 flagellar protein FlaG [Treponema putidum]UTY28721.1 flagellar protein FlaG [Treponema putidum]UTY31151.1 flagellar protein FlaG [Treponema putidum]UTY33588.1 flagellar protein FlaG [Treponema putidum]